MADYIDCYNAYPASEAKKEYFLQTKDLLGVPYESESFGFGTGRPIRWYSLDDLEAVAVAKHGAAGLAKKRAARKKRQENQQLKELAAQKAKETIGTQLVNNENAAPNNSNPSSESTIKPSAKELQKLQKDIAKAFKPLLTWDYMRSKRQQNFCAAKAQVPRVSKELFAALIGRPQDTKLATVVKKGAWYREVVSFQQVFGHGNSIMGSGGRYGCNRELGIDSTKDVVVRYKPSDDTLSVEATVQHEATFD